MGIPTLPNQPPKPQIEGHEAEGEKKDNASSSRLVQQDVPDFYGEKHLEIRNAGCSSAISD